VLVKIKQGHLLSPPIPKSNILLTKISIFNFLRDNKETSHSYQSVGFNFD
jgi:hypothetical protein